MQDPPPSLEQIRSQIQQLREEAARQLNGQNLERASQLGKAADRLEALAAEYFRKNSEG